MRRLWELDGGLGDNHRVMLDERGEWWGWENLKPRDLKSLSAALIAGVSRWHHYAVCVVQQEPA